MVNDPFILQTIQDALSQAGISGDGKLSGGAHLGALDQPAQPGALALEGSIRKSIAIGARVERAADQAIPTAVNTAVSFSAAGYDPFGMWRASTPTRLTAYTAGFYLASGLFAWAANATGIRIMKIYVNGGNPFTGCGVPGSALAALAMTASGLVYLNEGDYLELIAYQTSGGSLTIGGGYYPIQMSVARIA